MRFDAVIFDFDGVLVISEHLNVEAMATTMKLRGTPLTPEEIATIPGKSSADALPEFLRRRGVFEKDHAAIIEENRARYDHLWESGIAIAPHAEDVIHFLHHLQVSLAIGTTNRRPAVNKFLDRLHAHRLFPVVVTGQDVAKRKPHPEVYLTVQSRLGVSAEKILVVEDTPVGLAAAKAAKLTCAVIPSEFFKNEDFGEADLMLGSLQDLPAIVLRP